MFYRTIAAAAVSRSTPTWFRQRRLWVLSRLLARAIPGRGTVLDVGCGDGRLAQALMALRPDLRIEGVDRLPQVGAAIAVSLFDGVELPFADRSFDHVTVVDAAGGARDTAGLLAEAARVARHGVVVKDRQREGTLARQTLGLMDAVSGRSRGMIHVCYRSEADWHGVYFKARLQASNTVSRLQLYLPPLGWLLNRRLHFVTLLSPRRG